MWLNILLAFGFFAVMGCIAHRIVGGSGSIMHYAFIGVTGYGISQGILDILGMLSIGLFGTLVCSLACSCGVILIINRIRHYIIINRMIREQDSSTEDTTDDNDNSSI